jgi:hypothetical protein
MPRGTARWLRVSQKDASEFSIFDQVEENGISLLKVKNFTALDVGDYQVL